MKHLFVPYELAVKAKEKGFDEPCFRYYRDNADLAQSLFEEGVSSSDLNFGCAAAPLYSQLVDWFREEHGLHIYLEAGIAEGGVKRYCFTINSRNVSKTVRLPGPVWQAYYKALEAALTKSFELI